MRRKDPANIEYGKGINGEQYESVPEYTRDPDDEDQERFDMSDTECLHLGERDGD